MPSFRNPRTNEVSVIELGRTYDREGQARGWAVTIDGKARRLAMQVAAATAYHEAVAACLGEGFVVEFEGAIVATPPPASFSPCPELEAEVEASGSEDAWSVLGDAWASAGDPRGECVLLERVLLGNRDPSEFMRRKKLLAGARQVRDAHVLGALGTDAYRVRVRYERSLAASIELREEVAAPGRTTGELLGELLANPFCRFARALDVWDCDVASALAGIGAATRPLRELKVQSPTTRRADIAPLADALPRLERLEILARRIDWGHLELPALTELVVRSTLDDVATDALVDWLSQHVAIERVSVTSETTTDLLDGWVGDHKRWPASLRRLAWGRRVGGRERVRERV